MKGKDCDVRLQNRRVLGAGVLALGAALVLAGCGAGQITQTDSQQPAVNGTYAQVKTIALRNAAVQYPEGGASGYPAGATPSLTLTIVNQGTQDDTLTSVALDGGAAATIGGAKTIVAGHALVIGPGDAVESTNEAASSSAPSTTGSAPVTTGTATSSEAPSSSATEPATGTTAAGEPGKGTITLPALPKPLWPGQVIKVVFTFQNAGSITVELPIAAPAHAEE